MTDVFAKEKRSEIMARIRSKDTGPEREFQRLHPEAVPHPDWLPYRPDFLLGGRAVFVDSGFWHGGMPLGRWAALPEWWKEKLFRNVVRDACRCAFYSSIGRLRIEEPAG
jgi:DNA mismatch endonuclease (patch repair protein)